MVYDLLSGGVGGAIGGVRASAPWQLIRVAGPDAVEFLHRICSQDVESLGIAAAAPACFLTPKGKLTALAMLGRDDEGVWVECAGEAVDTLYEFLDRFHFTERLELTRPDFVAAEVFGSDAWGLAGLDGAGCVVRDGVVAIGGERFGLRWARVHGPSDAIDAWRAGVELAELDGATAKCLMLASAQLVVGVDTDDSTIALEAPVEDHISTTKGCYTGQEIVARIHTYGHVNRNLVLARVDGTASIEAGAAVCEPDDGDPVGRVTSSAMLPGGTATLALVYVPRDFATAGTSLKLGGLDGTSIEVVAFGS